MLEISIYLQRNDKTIDELFDQVDLDGDQNISLDETKQMLTLFNIQFDDEKAQIVMECFDFDNDGVIERYEFVDKIDGFIRE